MGQVLGVGWYRFRSTFRRHWSGYLGIVLLMGLIGGVAMASIVGARRTQSSYPIFVASTNTSDLSVVVFNNVTGQVAPPMTARIARLPGIKRVRVVDTPVVALLAPDGAPRLGFVGDDIAVGSTDGEFYEQDRLAVLEGARADPNRVDQMMITPSAAMQYDVHVGETLPLGFYTPAQTAMAGFGSPKVAPRLRIDAKVVGIVELSNEVIQDDIDRAYGFVFFSPALIREAAAETSGIGAYEMQLDRGASGVAAVEQEIIHAMPTGLTYEFHVTAPVISEVELAVKPESVALGAFGAIAALVCLLLAGQAIVRQLSLEDEERRVLWSFGASRAITVVDGLIGVLTAVLIGSLLAFLVAVVLSPLAPIGPVRAVYPDKGISVDWTVLGAGLVVLVCGLGVLGLVLAIRGAPRRDVTGRRSKLRGSAVVRAAEGAGIPIAGVEGLRLALEPGRANVGVPARSTLFGTVLAITLVVATLTFSSGLTTLVSHPALYGWDWNYALNPTNDVPPRILTLLNHDHDVAAWTGVDYTNVEIDDETVPVLITNAHPAVSPPVLSGHGLDSNDQIVIGAATLAMLHKRVGDTVYVSFATRADAPVYIPPTPLKVVGTATFPAVGFSSTVADHTSMGTGALVPTGVEPAAFQRAQLSSDTNLNGPELVFVRLRPGVGAVAGRSGLQRLAVAADKLFASNPNTASYNVTVIGVERPAQIVNYRSIGSTPFVLAVGLAFGAIVALALTLATSVRRRRRDLGLLKALGFTRRQLAAAVAWQASFAAAIGVVVGIPLGIALGRELWTLFARDINAVPDPTVPLLSVVLVGAGALVFANIVAAFPGRSAARTKTAVVLRTE